MSGKRERLVPVIISKDCIKGLKRITDLTIRKEIGLLDESQNKYVFANTGWSTNHVVGWQCIHNACLDSGMANPDHLTATANQHRVSTHFAGLDLSEQDRQLFYAHMGHEGNVNQGTYQHPLAVQEVIVIGSRLHEMDGESPDQH